MNLCFIRKKLIHVKIKLKIIVPTEKLFAVNETKS